MPPDPSSVTRVFDVEVPLPLWAVVSILGFGGLALHWFLRTAARKWARRTAGDLDDLLVEVLEKFLLFWIFLAVVYTGLTGLPLAGGRLVGMAVRGIHLAYIVTGFWALSSLLFRSLARWAERNGNFRPVHPPIRLVLKAVVLIVALLTVLGYFNVNVTALAATLGVGGIAVAFALKDTLENFFAGLHLMADRPLVEGDVVEVKETGDRGTVVKIGWRSVRVRTIDNNVLVVPNVKLASGILVNLTSLDPRITIRMQVRTTYDADPDRVAALLEETVREAAGRVPGIDGNSEPVAWLHPGFGESSLDFTLRYFADAFANNYPSQDGIRRRILKRFREEGGGPPYPITTLDLPEGSRGAAPPGTR